MLLSYNLSKIFCRLTRAVDRANCLIPDFETGILLKRVMRFVGED